MYMYGRSGIQLRSPIFLPNMSNMNTQIFGVFSNFAVIQQYKAKTGLSNIFLISICLFIIDKL